MDVEGFGMRAQYGQTGRSRLAIGALLGCLGFAQGASAQMISNVCQSMQGPRCRVNPAPVGSSCGCYTQFGPSPGLIAGMTPTPSYGGASINNVCQTYRGRCQTTPAPVGSVCGCYGDAGTVAGF